jgi:hypothetical protein
MCSVVDESVFGQWNDTLPSWVPGYVMSGPTLMVERVGTGLTAIAPGNHYDFAIDHTSTNSAAEVGGGSGIVRNSSPLAS